MDTLQNILTEIYDSYVSKVYQIYDIFKDQFGEENVDLQDVFPIPKLTNTIRSNCNSFEAETGKKAVLRKLIYDSTNDSCNIYVHWAHVRITNEFDKFTELNDLWAKVNIRYSGTIVGRFLLNRSNYSYLHISNNYMHSHISSIPFNDFTEFQVPCTGRGPINSTINSLENNFNEDLWRLFCCELNNFVTVESIAGRPYHSLESLGRTNSRGDDYTNYRLVSSLYSCVLKPFLAKGWQDFIKEVVNSKKLKFAYSNGAYIIGNSLAETTVILSDIFIKWFNKHHTDYPDVNLQTLLENCVLCKGIYQGGIIYSTGHNANKDFSSYINTKVLTFKGKDILLSIDGLANITNFEYFLTANTVNYIITIILQVLNYRYGRNTAKKTNNTSYPAEEYI